MNFIRGIGGNDNQEQENNPEAADAGNASVIDSQAFNDDLAGKMAGGDYLIHIHIQNAKNLDLENAQTFDPYIQIKILDQTKKTTVKQDVDKKSIVSFNEHLYFEFKNVDNLEISDAIIYI